MPSEMQLLGLGRVYCDRVAIHLEGKKIGKYSAKTRNLLVDFFQIGV